MENKANTPELSTAPDAKTLQDTLENVTPLIDKEVHDKLRGARKTFEHVTKEEYKTQYNYLRKIAYGKSPRDKSLQTKLGLHMTGNDLEDIESIRSQAQKRADDSAELAVQSQLGAELMTYFNADPESDDYTQTLNDFSRIVTASYQEWDGDEDQPGIDEQLEGIVANEQASVVTTPDNNTSEQAENGDGHVETPEVQQQLDAIRNKYAELIAERSKRSFERNARTGTIDDAREEVADMIGAVATNMMLDLSEVAAGEQVEQDVAELIDQFIAEQMEQLANEMEAIRASEFEDARPVTKKFLQRWASWGGGESWKARFKGTAKKAAILAIPTAALAIPMGLAAGAIGGVGVGALGAVLVGRGIRSIGRRLVGAKIDSVADAATIAHAQREDISHRLELETSNVHTDLLAIFDERSEAYRKRNQKRLLGGTAIALSAGIITGGLASLVADTGAGEYIGHHISNLFHKDHTPNYVVGTTQPVVNPGVHSDSVTPPYAPGQEPHLPGYFESHGSTTGDTTVDAPKGGIHTGTPEKDIQFGKSELHITRGEGWYHEFGELGVKPSDQQKLLELTGKHLVKEGIAYKDPNIGGYGINMTENGKMPDAALDYITQTAHEHGIHTDYDSHFDTPSHVETNHTAADHSQAADNAGSGHDVDTTHSGDTTSSSLNVDVNPGSTSTDTFTKSDVSNFNSWANGMEVQKGDSISKYAQNYLESHGYSNPSTAQIDQVRDRILTDWRSRGIVPRNGQLLKGDIIKTK